MTGSKKPEWRPYGSEDIEFFPLMIFWLMTIQNREGFEFVIRPAADNLGWRSGYRTKQKTRIAAVESAMNILEQDLELLRSELTRLEGEE